VDTGETLLHLAGAFQEALVAYVEGLHKHVVRSALLLKACH